MYVCIGAGVTTLFGLPTFWGMLAGYIQRSTKEEQKATGPNETVCVATFHYYSIYMLRDKRTTKGKTPPLPPLPQAEAGQK